jgi:hypothetical protein
MERHPPFIDRQSMVGFRGMMSHPEDHLSRGNHPTTEASMALRLGIDLSGFLRWRSRARYATE